MLNMWCMWCMSQAYSTCVEEYKMEFSDTCNIEKTFSKAFIEVRAALFHHCNEKWCHSFLADSFGKIALATAVPYFQWDFYNNN